MPRKFCVTCNSYQDSWYDTCGERCGNDCRERCRRCNHLFSGELVRGSNAEVIRANRDTQVAVSTSLARHADSSGGNVEVIGSAYETHIVYHPPRRS